MSVLLDLSRQAYTCLFAPSMLLSSFALKEAFHESHLSEDQPAPLIDRISAFMTAIRLGLPKIGAFFLGTGLTYILEKNSSERYFYLIPTVAVGATSIAAKIAFDFFAARPQSFNIFSYAPTRDLVSALHWGFVSSLALKSDHSEKPNPSELQVSKQEALEILEKTYELEEALELFGITFRSLFEAEVFNEDDQKNRENVDKKLREWLIFSISKLGLPEAEALKESPAELKGQNASMSLQESILSWMGEANFFHPEKTFSEDSQIKANTIAYFFTAGIASETLKSAHPILLNTAICASLAVISAIAMPIINFINELIFPSDRDRLISSNTDDSALKPILFWGNTAAALLSYYALPKLLPGSSALRIAVIQTVSFLALSICTARLLMQSPTCQLMAAEANKAKDDQESQQKCVMIIRKIKEKSQEKPAELDHKRNKPC